MLCSSGIIISNWTFEKMTWLTTILLRKASNNAFQRSSKKGQNFIDSLRIHVQGGAGGMGHPKYGGVGGRGGNVYVEGLEDMTLKDLKRSLKERQRVKASVGQNSSARCILGKPGDDVVIQCPTGVAIISEYGSFLGEILKEGDSVLVAGGGAGGGPTNGYCGLRGQSYTIRLDLKLIADVAFVGFPNAGKSTLLSKLSKAKPKIANYPFTTLRPSVGVVEFPDERQISLADLPGLIEGAHVNCGLGYHFLRHVERSKLLLLIADVQGFQLSYRHIHRSCLETILLLNRELELYKEYLLDKPAMLLINKMDTDGSEHIFQEVLEAAQDLSSVLHRFPEEIRPLQPFNFLSIQSISANNACSSELSELKDEIRRVLDLVEIESEAEAKKENELLMKLQRKLTDYGPAAV